jgi:type IV pilus assembly protein PilX
MKLYQQPAIPAEGFEISIGSYFEANSARDGRGMGQGKPLERKNSFQCFLAGATDQQQSGSVLLVALAVLLVLALLGLSGMNSTMMQARMTANTRTMQTALQAAEAALRDAEQDIRHNLGNASPFFTDCAHGLCQPSTAGLEVWQDNNKVNWATGANTISYGANTGNSPLGYLATQPRYIIERLQVQERGASLKKGLPSVSHAQWYRITAVGFAGANNAARVTLQSVYRK